MAGEITMTVFMQFNDGVSSQQSMTSSSVSVDVAGKDYIRATQNIGTSAEAISKGSITTPGYFIVHNMDATNYIEIGYDDTGFKPTVKLKAGEWAEFRLTQATPQAKADTAACDIEYLMIED